MRTDGRLQTAEQFKNVIIRTNSDGTMVRVGDVAEVNLGSKDYSVTSKLNDSNAAGFMVSLTSDANAMQSVSGAKAVLEKAKESFPSDMDYEVSTTAPSSSGPPLKKLSRPSSKPCCWLPSSYTSSCRAAGRHSFR